VREILLGDTVYLELQPQACTCCMAWPTVPQLPAAVYSLGVLLQPCTASVKYQVAAGGVWRQTEATRLVICCWLAEVTARVAGQPTFDQQHAGYNRQSFGL